MATRVLELIEDRLGAGESVSLPTTNRIVYVVEGEAEAQADGASERITPNEARHYSGGVTLRAGDGGARLWRWELSTGGIASRTKLSAAIAIDENAEYLMRCDRVDFPLGGIAYTHTHQGPGIRCLFMGEFDVTVDGRSKHLLPGEAWFEAGPDPVYAEASKTELTAFIRVMVLPRRLLGQSSIRYVKSEDADKPKTQTYTVFVDQPIEV